MIIFDYVYYRIANFFLRKDGMLGIRAVAFVSLGQAVIVGAFFAALSRKLFLGETFLQSKMFSYSGLVLLALLAFFNYLRYKKISWRLFRRWKYSETFEQKVIGSIGTLIFILLPLTLALLIRKFT